MHMRKVFRSRRQDWQLHLRIKHKLLDSSLIDHFKNKKEITKLKILSNMRGQSGTICLAGRFKLFGHFSITYSLEIIWWFIKVFVTLSAHQHNQILKSLATQLSSHVIYITSMNLGFQVSLTCYVPSIIASSVRIMIHGCGFHNYKSS